jgi:hypothetical protein
LAQVFLVALVLFSVTCCTLVFLRILHGGLVGFLVPFLAVAVSYPNAFGTRFLELGPGGINANGLKKPWKEVTFRFTATACTIRLSDGSRLVTSIPVRYYGEAALKQTLAGFSARVE